MSIPPFFVLVLSCLMQATPDTDRTETFDQLQSRGVEALLVGRLDEAIGAFERCMELQPRGFGSAHKAYSLASAYARKGETEAALAWLEKCIGLGWFDYGGEVDWVPIDVDFAALNADPRYPGVLKKARESVESTAHIEPSLPLAYLDWNGGYSVSGGPIEFSPDGRKIASTSPGSWACVWDSTSGEQLLKLKHPSAVKLCSWVDAGRHLLTGARDMTVRFWDARTGELLRAWQGPYFLREGALSPDGRWNVGLEPCGVRLVDSQTVRGKRQYLGSPVYGVAFSPDGARLATACADGTTRLFEVDGARVLASHRGEAAVFDVTFSPDGRWLVTADADGVLRWLDARTLAPARSFRAHPAEINRVKFRPDGSEIATASVDRTAKVWNAADGSLRLTLFGHNDEVTWISYSPDGKRIVTHGGYDDRTTRIWDDDDGKMLLLLAGRKELQQSKISFSPDGARLVSYDARRSREWDTATGKEQASIGQRPVVRIRSGRSGLPLVLAGQESTWNESSSPVQIDGAGVGIDAVFFSADRLAIYSVDSDDHGRLWNAKTSHLVRDLGPLSTDADLLRACGRWSSACFSPDGSLLATAQQADGTTRVWETYAGEQIIAIPGGGNSYSVAFDDRGEQLAIVGSEEWRVEIWDVRSMERLRSFKASSLPKFVAFQPGGAMLATGNERGEIQLWDLTTSHRHRALKPMLATNVCGVAFSRDGTRLASTAGDHRIMLWDVEDGALLGTIVPGEERGDWLAFSPSGHYHGTSAAIERARLVQGAIPYPLSCFASILESAEEVQKALTGGEVDEPNLPAPPTLVLDNPRESTSAVSERIVRVEATAVEPLAGLSGIAVTQDGVSVPNDVLAGATTFRDNERLARLDLQLQIPAGASETKIMLQAVSARGIRSRSASFVLRYEPPKRDLYLLALGIADYAQDSLDLACPILDVDGLVARLEAQEGVLFNAVHLERRVDREVTSAEALRLRDEFLLRAKPDDTIVVFVAGHGVRTETGEYWFLTSDATPQRPYSGIKRSDLESLVTWDKLNATKRVLLLDTCYSGTAFGQGARGERGIAFQQTEVDTVLERSSGLYILAATSDDGFAREQEGNGLFTQALLDGLAGAADSGDHGDKDGTVGIDELMHFARYAVLERSEGRQRPTFPKIEGGENFPLARCAR